MVSSKEAELCIEKLNHTRLNGRIITVEKVDKDTLGTSKKADLNENTKKKSTPKKNIKTKSDGTKSDCRKSLKVDGSKELEKHKCKYKEKIADKKKEKMVTKVRTPSEERRRRDLSRERIRKERNYLAEMCDLLSLE